MIALVCAPHNHLAATARGDKTRVCELDLSFKVVSGFFFFILFRIVQEIVIKYSYL